MPILEKWREILIIWLHPSLNNFVIMVMERLTLHCSIAMQYLRFFAYLESSISFVVVQHMMLDPVLHCTNLIPTDNDHI